jgi:cytochrome b561
MSYGTSRPSSYDAVARLLHWLVVVLIVAQFLIGWTMPDVRHDTPTVGLIAWHLGVGATLLGVMVFRVLWRLTHRPPPDHLAPILRLASRITHSLLYLTLLAVPLLGWANASSRGWSVKLFGLLKLPPLTPTGSTLGHAMGDIHSVMAWILFGLICMHVMAAMFHRLILKDETLQRMLP